MKIGIIGGSGLYDIKGMEISKEVSVSTPYGEPSSAYRVGIICDRELVFLSRHGVPHSIPPHKINYRANIWGFRSLGVERIISVNAVGSISPDIQIGSIVIPQQLIDMTGGSRASTFYEGNQVVHVDFTDPFCPEIRNSIINASHNTGLSVINSGTYICVNGPRLETAKEIKFFSLIGADLVGMTVMPEAVLARELEICYSSISIVTNYAAGISEKRLTTTEVIETMKNSEERIRSLIKGVVELMNSARNCPCKHALRDAGL